MATSLITNYATSLVFSVLQRTLDLQKNKRIIQPKFLPFRDYIVNY